MAVDYKRYLAENVLSERRVVTCRLLSRALKVHSYLAKQMLFDFHQTENGKKPNSVSATYMISGVQFPGEKSTANKASNDGEDIAMRSSPYMSSMPQPDEAEPHTRTLSFVLAREEDLENAKATFESISTIYIYSLQSTPPQDLNVLADASREILTSFGSEDPLEFGKHWGMIQNERVRRRKAAKPPLPQTIPAPPKAEIAKQTSQPKPDAGVLLTKESAQPKAISKTNEKTISKPKKGDIFSSFANAKTKLKKEDSATSSVKSASENTKQKGMFDDDDDEEEIEEDSFSKSTQQKSASARESRKEREAKLKMMMEEEEDEDEDMPDADASDAPEYSATEDSQQIETQKEPEPEPEPKEEVTVQGGRRRGKRKIMKKKTIKDEEGYLVTVEEPAWESFSEDEPAPPPKKKAAISAGGKKAGQGNIMSFFSKK